MRAQSDARAALAVGLLAAVVFVVLAVLVMTPFGIAFDGAVLGGVQQTATPPVVAAMGLLTRLGNEFIVVALPLVASTLSGSACERGVPVIIERVFDKIVQCWGGGLENRRRPKASRSELLGIGMHVWQRIAVVALA